jgi:hypothetical protein
MLRPKDRVTLAGFEAIQPAMTLQEVEDILGGRPGYYAAPRIAITRGLNHGPTKVLEWWGARAVIFVEFAPDVSIRLTLYALQNPKDLRVAYSRRRIFTARRDGAPEASLRYRLEAL